MQIDLNTAPVIAGLVISALAILGTIFGWFGKVWAFFAGLFRKGPAVGLIDVPTKSMVVIPDSRTNALWWHMGRIGENAAMQVVGDFHVTNISKYGIYVMGARLRKPKAIGHAFVKAQDSNMFGSTHIIPSGAISQMRVDFWVQPPTKREGEIFRCDIAIVDQFGNEHWLKKLEFKSTDS